MQATFVIGPAFRQGSDPGFDAEVLSILLEAEVDIARAWLKRHPQTKPLYKSGVRYGRPLMPDGSLGSWASLPDVYASGIADCKALTPIRIAELRQAGVPCQPVFRTLVVTDPRGREKRSTHILVAYETKGGLFQKKIAHEDPSAKLGMHDYYGAQHLTATVV